MAQTKKKRKRKHRGTQGGSVARGTGGRPRSREQARAQARQNAEDRRLREPTWGSAAVRGGVGALVFFVLMLLIFRNPLGQSVALAAFMFVVYVPLGLVIDRFFWKRRMAQIQRQRLAAKQERSSSKGRR
ncbi:hypothetical protein HJD18_08845 [Thermoleophilia bacterium SCSIO 60948]|nr:hypothetical protein HJD18_08845 [Thermoleophilia bacterium SCSIO 60948]